ncbi:hypothetical protein JNW88_10320 [Micromonospora sp. ATA32]|nr:hypothetical protein [Micromonospora sp. ATA32]
MSEVLAIGAGAAQVQAVPVNRVAALARYGWAGKAPLLKGLAEPRKTATLLATARRLEAAAVDDALDLFDSLMATRLIGPARRATDRARLEAMPTLLAIRKNSRELGELGLLWPRDAIESGCCCRMRARCRRPRSDVDLRIRR